MLIDRIRAIPLAAVSKPQDRCSLHAWAIPLAAVSNKKYWRSPHAHIQCHVRQVSFAYELQEVVDGEALEVIYLSLSCL
jgi:hypothetical protein